MQWEIFLEIDTTGTRMKLIEIYCTSRYRAPEKVQSNGNEGVRVRGRRWGNKVVGEKRGKAYGGQVGKDTGPDVMYVRARGVRIRRRPTLPHSLPCSTIGAEELNFRVRNGNGWGLFAMTTENLG